MSSLLTSLRHLASIAALGALALGGCVMAPEDPNDEPVATDASDVIDLDLDRAHQASIDIASPSLVPCTDVYCPTGLPTDPNPMQRELVNRVNDVEVDIPGADALGYCTDIFCTSNVPNDPAPVSDDIETWEEAVTLEPARAEVCTDDHCIDRSLAPSPIW